LLLQVSYFLNGNDFYKKTLEEIKKIPLGNACKVK